MCPTFCFFSTREKWDWESYLELLWKAKGFGRCCKGMPPRELKLSNSAFWMQCVSSHKSKACIKERGSLGKWGQATWLNIPYVELQTYIQKPTPSLSLPNSTADLPVYNVLIMCIREWRQARGEQPFSGVSMRQTLSKSLSRMQTHVTIIWGSLWVML